MKLSQKRALEIKKEKTKTELWDNPKRVPQGSERGFGEGSKQGQVSRKRTWRKCCLGSQELESSKKDRAVKMVLVLRWFMGIMPLELKMKM